MRFWTKNFYHIKKNQVLKPFVIVAARYKNVFDEHEDNIEFGEP